MNYCNRHNQNASTKHQEKRWLKLSKVQKVYLLPWLHGRLSCEWLKRLSTSFAKTYKDMFRVTLTVFILLNEWTLLILPICESDHKP